MTEQRSDQLIIPLRLNDQQQAFVERMQRAHYPELSIAEMVKRALKETAEAMPTPTAGGLRND